MRAMPFILSIGLGITITASHHCQDQRLSMRCENCDSCVNWQGDRDALDMDFDQEKWMFVRVYICMKCGCVTHVYFPKEPSDESMQ